MRKTVFFISIRVLSRNGINIIDRDKVKKKRLQNLKFRESFFFPFSEISCSFFINVVYAVKHPFIITRVIIMVYGSNCPLLRVTKAMPESSLLQRGDEWCR